MIHVNKEQMPWEPGMTVRDILDRRNYSFPLLVVKVNGEVVSRQAYDVYPIEDEADVSVIHLMCGG
jgi:sulfur carrier protein